MTSHASQGVARWLAALEQPQADRDYRPGHARVKALLAGLPLVAPRWRVRIAGTNGKGSTAWMLASALQAAGLRVGLYTSPHILRFNERIRIDGAPVAEERLAYWLARIVPAAREIGASWFEGATAAALACFSEARVDVEILEAGVGARLDATTAVPADLALLTPIGLDHQAWLGETLTRIAAEKAHAADGCAHVISAPQAAEAKAVLAAHCGARLMFAPVWPENRPLAAQGGYQRVNAGLALAGALASLESWNGRAPDAALAAALREAVAGAVPPGRLQRVRIRTAGGCAEVWLDAAHNAHAVAALLPWLEKQARFDAILAFTRADRSLKNCLPQLAPFADRVLDGADAPAAGEALARELQANPNGRFLALGSFITLGAIARRFDLRLEQPGFNPRP